MKISTSGTPYSNELLKKEGCSTLNMLQRFKDKDISKEFDLIVIGGGINGCGIARDASERGLSVLLLEKEDFGSGCTSASTRLIHGGLRYLEHFEFDLVRESLREREILLQNANHLVKPIELCIPIYKTDKRGYFLIKTGMILYDLLSFDKSLPGHKMMSKSEFINYEPSVRKENLKGAALYYDAQVTYAERLCVENAIMAKNNGALVLNHAEVISFEINSGEIASVRFLDKLTGKAHKVKGKSIINVSGPWVDSLCGLVDKNIKKQIGGTKGSHIIIKKFNSGPKHALYVNAKSDSRPFFILPWQDYYLIGTTDIPFSGNLDELKAHEDEIKYLIGETNNVLESKKISISDILFSYSGVRPLPYTGNQSNPAKITRKHIIHEHVEEDLSNFISVIGGKLTTYRNLSEQAVDLVYKKLGYDFISSKTKNKPLIGNIDSVQKIEAYKKSQAKKLQRRHDLDQEIVFHLIDLYGKRYKEVLDLTVNNPEQGKLLSSYSLDIRAEVEFSICKEMAYTLSDVLLRRTVLGLNENLGEDAIPEVLRQLQILLDLSNGELKQQTEDYIKKIVQQRKL